MTDNELQLLYLDLYKSWYPGKNHQIEAGFYSTKSLRHTISIRFGRIEIRVADRFRSVPQSILFILGIILFSKLFRQKVNPEFRRKYRDYIREHILPEVQTISRPVSRRYTPEGKVYNLISLFEELNDHYFSGQLPVPKLGWSMHKSYRRLGFYSEDKNLLVISRIFDHKKVPLQVIQFLVYHEMLHIHLPSKNVRGRKRSHNTEFRAMEQAFPNFKEINRWISLYAHRL